VPCKRRDCMYSGDGQALAKSYIDTYKYFNSFVHILSLGSISTQCAKLQWLTCR